MGFVEQFFSWQVIFASLWSIILAVPLPFLLLMLFKKRVVLPTMTEEQKEMTIQIWIWKERVGWTIVFLVQATSLVFLFSFVRHYPWAVIEKWLSTTAQSVFHRLITAPGIRAVWIGLLLLFSRFGGCLDFCLIMQPGLTTFNKPLGPHGVHWRSTPGADVDEDSDLDLGEFTEEVEEGLPAASQGGEADAAMAMVFD